jgi:hypothetical protein
MVRYGYSTGGTGSPCFRRPLTAPVNFLETKALKGNCDNHPCGQQEPSHERICEALALIFRARFSEGNKPYEYPSGVLRGEREPQRCVNGAAAFL